MRIHLWKLSGCLANSADLKLAFIPRNKHTWEVSDGKAVRNVWKPLFAYRMISSPGMFSVNLALSRAEKDPVLVSMTSPVLWRKELGKCKIPNFQGFVYSFAHSFIHLTKTDWVPNICQALLCLYLFPAPTTSYLDEMDKTLCPQKLTF